MLWMLSALLLVLWLSGMVAGVGAWVHVVLVLAAVAVVCALMRNDPFEPV